MDNHKLHISQSEWEKIEDFLFGKLATDEINAIEKQIETDTIFAQKVNEVKSVILAVQEFSLVEKTEQWHKELHDTPIVPIQRKHSESYIRYISIASALLILIVCAWWWLFPSKEEKLFADFYRPDPGLPTVMSLSENYEFEKAMVDYKSENYAEALTSWEKLLTEHPESDTLLFFIGSSLLAQKNAKASIPYFEKVISDEKSIFRSESYWYLGLALLKENQTDKAKNVIQLSNHDRKQDILKKL